MNCAKCISSTQCSTTCDAGAVYLNQKCLLTVPVGYVNISSIAVACKTGCTTCSILSTNCTSCDTGYYFYFYSCVSDCPSGYVKSGVNCTICTSPCLTCSINPTNCLSCDSSVSPSVYLSGTSCVTICPQTTYANLLNNNCTSCTSPCLTCSNSINCLSCVATYSLYGSSCISNCPSGYISINSIC
jgi:proprotein convertase subtilisin/kexin type 5